MLAQTTGWARRQAASTTPYQALGGFSCSLASSQSAAGPPHSGEDADSSGRSSSQLPLPPPALPLPAQQQHWLDRHFPGVRHWLDDKNRKWWIKGLVQARCKQYHQLEGREAELRRFIETEYQAALQRHAVRAVDERAETHLQVAALALASHKALLPYLRDEGEVLQIIREHMGGRTAALLRFLLAATKFLQRDGYAALTARLHGLQWDMGAGFASQLQLGDRESRLVISRCFYHDLFSDAGQPQLAAACCCSLDRVWFETPFRGVAAGCTEAISAGDQRCCFTVRRQAPP